MKIQHRYWFLFVSFLGMLVYSCEKDNALTPSTDVPNNATVTATQGRMQLGKQLENPYSVANMQKALARLQATNPSATHGENITISPTHLYLRFKPKTEEELSILQSDPSLILYTYPLDYEIQQAGDYYRDPAVPAGQPTYQYCAVEVDRALPQGVEYDLLEELFIPDDYSDAAKAAPKPWAEALVDESLRLTGNWKEETTAQAKRSSWRPAGRIRLFDDELGRLVGLSGAKVRANRWFTTHEGITNANGNFSCNGTFNRDANYSIKWERNDFDIRSGSLGQATLNGPKRTGDWNHDIRSGVQRMYAIVNQACADYYYGNRLGLKSPPQNSFWNAKLKVSVWDEPNPDANGSHCKDCRFLGISSRLRIWNNGRSCMHIYATTIHEIAHASHWELRRNNWNNNSTSRKVKETWARGVQWAIGRLRYPGYRGGATIRPDYTQLVVDMIDGPTDVNEGSENLFQDNVTGYTIRQIEDVLSTTSNWADWETNLRNRYNNPTEQNLGALFDHWE